MERRERNIHQTIEALACSKRFSEEALGEPRKKPTMIECQTRLLERREKRQRGSRRDELTDGLMAQLRFRDFALLVAAELFCGEVNT